VTITHPRVTAIIITRDRVSYAQQCLRALMGSTGIGDVHLVDHGSTYGPMLDWLGRAAGLADWHDGGPLQSRVHVHWMPNQHPRDLWAPGNVLEKIIKPGQRFLVTDHDVVAPADVDWLDTLHALLDERPDVIKAGLQLAIDDLPVHPRTLDVLQWEASYRPPRASWKIPDTFGSPGWAEADVDTTIALYRNLEPFALGPALRTIGRGVQARHLSWYEDPDDLNDEQRWYAERAVHGHWRRSDGFLDNHGLAAS
jgi:hypothetical protein